MDKVGHQTLETMAFAKWYNQWLYELMKPHLTSEILEIGSGIGNFTKLLLKEGKVTATDISDAYLKKLANFSHPDLTVGYGDIEKGEFFVDNKNYKTVVCLNVLEHVEDDAKAIGNTFKILIKGGKFIILVPAHDFLFSEFDKKLGHHRRYRKHELLVKLQKAGFKIREIRYLNWWAAIGWLFWMKFLGSEDMPIAPVGIFDKLGKLFLWPEKYITAPFGLSVYAVAEK